MTAPSPPGSSWWGEECVAGSVVRWMQVTAFLAWLDEQEAAQAAKAAHEEPAYTSKQVLAEFDKLDRSFTRVSNKKKPKPPPEPAPVKPAASDSGAAS
ncbi:uncharacterized protein HaLaN_01624, partial [Haematococcus lacustris]